MLSWSPVSQAASHLSKMDASEFMHMLVVLFDSGWFIQRTSRTWRNYFMNYMGSPPRAPNHDLSSSKKLRTTPKQSREDKLLHAPHAIPKPQNGHCPASDGRSDRRSRGHRSRLASRPSQAFSAALVSVLLCALPCALICPRLQQPSTLYPPPPPSTHHHPPPSPHSPP